MNGFGGHQFVESIIINGMNGEYSCDRKILGHEAQNTAKLIYFIHRCCCDCFGHLPWFKNISYDHLCEEGHRKNLNSTGEVLNFIPFTLIEIIHDGLTNAKTYFVRFQTM